MEAERPCRWRRRSRRCSSGRRSCSSRCRPRPRRPGSGRRSRRSQTCVACGASRNIVGGL
ncbi:MAG: hypothetical protein EPO22_02230 [Dehalococcoidia bacterium]|nr:MAG: hypothetical protein EPO22_02230 [Dehalococcoidia bacterium]